MCVTINAQIFPFNCYLFSFKVSYTCRLREHKNLPLENILIFPTILIETKTKKELECITFTLVSLFIILDIRADNCFVFS